METYMKKLTISIITILSLIMYDAQSVDITKSVTKGEFKKVGAAGGQFLKIGVGARAGGMAGAYGALANDLTAVHWNPAGIADLQNMSGYFSYTQWVAGLSHNFAAISLPVAENFTAAASFISFLSDRIPVTTLEFPDGTGNTYRYNDVAVGITFSGYLTTQFSFGITAKYISSTFASLYSDGIAFDVGTMYDTGIQGIKLGFSMHNLGTEQEYRGVDLKSTKKYIEDLFASSLDIQYLASPFAVPLIFRAGATSDVLDIQDHKLIAAVDFVTSSDVAEQFALGTEYTWMNFVSVRAGYRFGSDMFGFSAGAGLKYLTSGFTGQIDYSISPSFELGLVNRLSIVLNLGD